MIQMTLHICNPLVTILDGAPATDGWDTVDLTKDSSGNSTGLSGVCLVIGTIYSNTWAFHAIEPAGDAGHDWYLASGSIADGQGTCLVTPNKSRIRMPPYQSFIAVTKADGTIRIIQKLTSANRWVYLEAWIDAPDFIDAGIPGGVNLLGPSAAPLVWTADDISSIIGVTNAFCFCRETGSAGGSGRYSVRYSGDVSDYGEAWISNHALGASTVGRLAAAKSRGLFAITAAGVYEEFAAGAQNRTLDLLGWVGGVTIAETEIFAAGALPVAWGTPLATGLTDEALVALRFTLVSGGGAERAVSVRKYGDTFDYSGPTDNCSAGVKQAVCRTDGQSEILVTTCDSSGQVETCMATGATWKVDLVAYLSTNIGPTLTPTAPVGTVFPGAAIEWSTSDPDDGDDQTKTILNLTDPLMNTHNAVVAGVVQAGFSGGATPNTSGGFDWSITVDGGMDPGTWSAYAYCEDFTGVSDDDTWEWTVEYEELYRNQVWDTIEGRYVQWLSSSGYDVGGASYPYPAHWPADVSNYVGKGSYLTGLTPSLSYRNQVWDEVAVAFVLWATVGAYDITGASYPGPGVWGVTTNSYVGRGYYG